MRSLLLPIALTAALVASPFAPARAETLRVFAAASLTEAFQDIGALYRQQNPGDEVEFNFAGSQILRTQIEQGAPADVFASADRVQMDALKDARRVGPDAIFATNRLVVVTPAGRAKVGHLADLVRPGARLVIANGNVPVGRYTAQVLGKMTGAGRFGADFQKRFMANVVSQESNVRAVLIKVSLDEADAGVVYATDAHTFEGNVAVIDVPDSMNVAARYPIAVVSSSAAGAAANRFMALVMSKAGQAVLARHGFGPAE